MCVARVPLLPGPDDTHDFEIGTGEEDDYAVAQADDEDDGFIVDDDDVIATVHERAGHRREPQPVTAFCCGRSMTTRTIRKRPRAARGAKKNVLTAALDE